MKIFFILIMILAFFSCDKDITGTPCVDIRQIPNKQEEIITAMERLLKAANNTPNLQSSSHNDDEDWDELVQAVDRAVTPLYKETCVGTYKTENFGSCVCE